MSKLGNEQSRLGLFTDTLDIVFNESPLNHTRTANTVTVSLSKHVDLPDYGRITIAELLLRVFKQTPLDNFPKGFDLELDSDDPELERKLLEVFTNSSDWWNEVAHRDAGDYDVEDEGLPEGYIVESKDEKESE